MLTGVIYTIIGIKNKLLHIYLSAAYLASLGVTVLIVYVMNPPISNAIQGAYVVAIILTGFLVGGAAVMFSDMTEGLGCLLGGFCFSMWLLVLKPGGLVTSTGSKAGFIAAFSVAAYATSFHHITRPYGLIISIPFAGATAVVLGIDCFSQSGLKEFWAYIWDLNNNLFSLGTTTYPLTRGIRVEIAAIVITFLAGIVSQVRLWKIIKKHREQRAAERLEDERAMEQEEANIGRRVEEHNAQERGQWETVYGDKDGFKGSSTSNRDSGVEDMDSHKKEAMSTTTSFRHSGDNEIEMSNLPSPTLTAGAGLVMTSNGQEGGPITIRVARDPEPPTVFDENGNPVETSSKHPDQASAANSAREELDQEREWVIGTDGDAHFERRPSQRKSRISSGPEVVPLPFKVPEDDAEDDRSSVATFADEKQEASNRRSKHLSAGSAFIRRLSARSNRSSKRYSTGKGNSTEDLVVPHLVEDDRRSSVAATLDGLSDDGDARSARSSFGWNKDVDGEAIVGEDSKMPEAGPASASLQDVETSSRPKSALTVATYILDPDQKKLSPERHATRESLTLSTNSTPPLEQSSEAGIEPSVVSATELKQENLTKDCLPQLSKVVMSYRTNEWAKHLSSADAPEPEQLKLETYPVETESTKEEIAAPVRMEELQQTAENAAPPPARNVSQMSSSAANLTRSSSAQSQSSDNTIIRLTSQLSLQGPPIRGPSYRSSSTPIIPQQILESPIEEEAGFSSPNLAQPGRFSTSNTPFGSTNNLISQRDTILRGKRSFTSPSALASTPEMTTSETSNALYRNPSEAGSFYNNPYSRIATHVQEDDTMSLSARRELIRQSSLQTFGQPQSQNLPFDTHQPKRQSSTIQPVVREQRLATFRQSVQNDLQNAVPPAQTIERQRTQLRQEKQAEESKKTREKRIREEMDGKFDQRMRRGDMLDAHREALRKMQAAANKNP
jgi:hypothetical protein